MINCGIFALFFGTRKKIKESKLLKNRNKNIEAWPGLALVHLYHDSMNWFYFFFLRKNTFDFFFFFFWELLIGQSYQPGRQRLLKGWKALLITKTNFSGLIFRGLDTSNNGSLINYYSREQDSMQNLLHCILSI